MKKVGCKVSPFFTRTRTVRPVYEPSSDLSQERKSSRDSENERIRIQFERQKERILAEVRSEIQKHEPQAESDKGSIQELNGIIGSQRREVDHAHAGNERLRRDQQLLHEQLLKQNWDLREAHEKSLKEMEELKRFKLVEDQDTVLALTGKTKELQNVINCMNDSRDLLSSLMFDRTGRPVGDSPDYDSARQAKRANSCRVPSKN